MAIPPGYAQANFIFTGAALPTGAECTLGFDISGGSPTPTAMANSLATDWAAADIEMSYVNDVTLSSIMVKFGPDTVGPSAVVATNIPGTGVDDPCPPNVTLLIRKNTALGGRAGRGRLYLPGVPEGSVSQAGVVDAATVTDTTTRFNNFLTACIADGNIPVLLHGLSGPILVPTEITSFACQAIAATQRRRLRR